MENQSSIGNTAFLTSLEIPSEAINEREKLNLLHRRDNPNDAIGEVNKTTGANDSGTGDTDYLKYTLDICYLVPT